MKNINILVIDGQGGGIGKSLVLGISQKFNNINIIAAGTTDIACENMKKAGANISVWGEENIIKLTKEADIITGVMGVMVPFGIRGEITPAISEAVFKSNAVKIMVPMNKCHIRIAAKSETLKNHIDMAINMIGEEIEKIQKNYKEHS